MKAFAGEYRAVKIHVLVKGGLIDGEKVAEAFEAPVDDKMVPRPVTVTQEKRLPEGKYKAGDMKFYALGTLKYKSGDVIEYDEIKYRIGDSGLRPEGGFVSYMGKRIYDQA